MHMLLIGLLQLEIEVGCTHGDPPLLGQVHGAPLLLGCLLKLRKSLFAETVLWHEQSLYAMQGHLDEARALSRQLPAEAKPLMLPAVAADLYLKALEKQDFNVFATQLQNGGFTPLWYQILVKYNLMLGKF